MTEQKQELLPCPFCGEKPNGNLKPHHADCYFSLCWLPNIPQHLIDAAWNRRAIAQAPAVPKRVKIEDAPKGLFKKEASAWKMGWNMCRAATIAAAQPAPIDRNAIIDWQPIETAPKDGTEIIGLRGGDVRICSWEPLDNPVAKHWGLEGTWTRWDGISGKSLMRGNFEPTHWIPMPALKTPADRCPCHDKPEGE